MAQAGWFHDPRGAYQLRYWDGSQWTEHVITDEVQGIDPTFGDVDASPQPQHASPEEYFASTAVGAGDTRLLTAPILHYAEFSAGLTAMVGNFTVTSPEHGPLATINQQQGAAGRRVMDPYGRHVMSLSRPQRKRYDVHDAGNNHVGSLVVERFASIVLSWTTGHGQPLGEVRARDLRGTEFLVTAFDDSTAPVVSIARTTPLLKDLVHNHDTYVLHRHQPLAWPLDWLSFATPLVIDHLVSNTTPN
jgi:hypothetical protein